MSSKHGGKLILFGILVISIILIVGSVYFFGPDNFIEEKAEEIIKEKTGISIDLTPASPEFGMVNPDLRPKYLQFPSDLPDFPF